MDIVITQWALDSYLDLKHQNVFSPEEFRCQIKPDVELLKQYPNDTKFENHKFWSLATDRSGTQIPHGFKMKWRQVGNGKVQLRLPVAILKKTFLCHGYVKRDDKVDKRMMAKFKTRIQLIQQARYRQCGVL